MRPDQPNEHHAGCGHSRRTFLTGLAAAGIGVGAAACGGGTNNEQAAAPAAEANAGDAIPDAGNENRISVHHHYAPPMWVKVLTENDALNAEAWKGWQPSHA